MTLLSKELRRYYFKEGNRFVFKNGMTLNKLAWEMWERLGYKEIDPSVISRVLKGDRLFTLKQLDSFSKTLRIPRKGATNLKTALFLDLNNRFGSNLDFFEQSNKAFIALSEENLIKIRQLKQKDLPELGFDWIDQILELIDTRLSGFLDEQSRKLLMKIYGQLLVEKMYLIQVIEPKEEGLAKILPVSKELFEIGKRLSDQSLVCLASHDAGDILYINNQFGDAVKLLRLGVGLYDGKTKKIRHWPPIRELALSFAYMGKAAEFDEAKRQIVKILPTLSLDGQTLAMEGIAKGEGVLGRKSEWEKWLTSSYKAQKQLQENHAPYEKLMRCLLIGSELEITRRLNIKTSPNYIGKIVKEGAEIAETYGYGRILQKIKFFADEERFSEKPFDIRDKYQVE